MQGLCRAASSGVLALVTLADASHRSSAQSASGDAAFRAAAPRNAKVVQVAPPTGVREADRRSILAALQESRPGDTIQFARGMYLAGRLIPVSTPRLTLLGHPEGTTLRGCDPAELDVLERELARQCNPETLPAPRPP